MKRFLLAFTCASAAMLAIWGVGEVWPTPGQAQSHAQVFPKPNAAEKAEAAQLCTDYPLWFSPVPHHKLIGMRCVFVRFDTGALEDLFAVWAEDVGPVRTRMYFQCIWYDGNPETNSVRVYHVGQTDGVDC